MERATIELAPPMLPVVKARDDGVQSRGHGRALRMAIVGLALAAGLACAVVLSRGALPGNDDGEHGSVALDQFAGTFGQTKLARLPLHNEPSTNDLISIMRGNGRQDVSADQGMLFAGGAGGKIHRSDPDEGLWRAAERASRLEHHVHKTATHDTYDDDLQNIERGDAQDNEAQPVKSPAVPKVSVAAVHAKAPSPAPKKVAAGWTADDERHKMTTEKHDALLGKGSTRPAPAAAHDLAKVSDGSGAQAQQSAPHAQKLLKQFAAAHVKPWGDVASKVSDAQDGYFKRHMSVDDALDQVAKIRAQHDAAESAQVMKARLAKEAKMSRERRREVAKERDAKKMAREEAAHAKAMEAKAVKAARAAEADELKAARDSAQMKQQLALKRKEAKELAAEKRKLALASLPKQAARKREEASAAAPKAVSAGWTQADATRAAQLEKKFAQEAKVNLASARTPDKALDIYQTGYTGSKLAGAATHDKGAQVEQAPHWKARALIGDTTAQAREHAKDEAAAREVAPLYPTGFIPSRKQHDDAHQPDAMPEMISGIHAARPDRVHPLSLDREAQNLQRESRMEGKEAVEERLRRQEEDEQEALYKEGHTAASQESAERAGERLVTRLNSDAQVARVMEKVDMTGIPFAASLKEAIAGDDRRFRAFEQSTWMDECGGSQLMLTPVTKQMLAIMDGISTRNASAWLDVEDAERRADAAEADLRSAEAGLVAVLESEDRTKTVELLEKLRERHEQRRAERRAASISRANDKEGKVKAALLLQQREALQVLSHAEEAQALTGDKRRVELNKAAFGAQDAVNKEEKLAEGDGKAPGYVAGFESKLLATATRPWSLDAQEGVQTLLGDVNSKILALEHAQQARSARLTSLEAKVGERMHKVSEVDAAEQELKVQIASEHEKVQGLRGAAASADEALTRAMRTYQLLLSADAAEAQAAQQAVGRLQTLMEACSLQPDVEVQAAAVKAAEQVKPWVTSAAALASQHKARAPAPAARQHKQAKPRQEEQSEDHVAGQEKMAMQLDKQLEQLKPLAQERQAVAAAHSHKQQHKTQLSSSPAQHAGRTIRIGGAVYVRETPATPRSGAGKQQAEDALLSREMAIADRDESTMENSEEQKLSSVASMIVSDGHA